MSETIDSVHQCSYTARYLLWCFRYSHPRAPNCLRYCLMSLITLKWNRSIAAWCFIHQREELCPPLLLSCLCVAPALVCRRTVLSQVKVHPNLHLLSSHCCFILKFAFPFSSVILFPGFQLSITLIFWTCSLFIFTQYMKSYKVTKANSEVITISRFHVGIFTFIIFMCFTTDAVGISKVHLCWDNSQYSACESRWKWEVSENISVSQATKWKKLFGI
jgi:hypothetical protein